MAGLCEKSMDSRTGIGNSACAGMPELKELQNLLECPICFEYIETAMMVPKCSHTFCSLCIRRYIGYKMQCPTCLVTVAETELVNNRLIDDLITKFKAVRPTLTASTQKTLKNSPDLQKNGIVRPADRKNNKHYKVQVELHNFPPGTSSKARHPTTVDAEVVVIGDDEDTKNLHPSQDEDGESGKIMYENKNSASSVQASNAEDKQDEKYPAMQVPETAISFLSPRGNRTITSYQQATSAPPFGSPDRSQDCGTPDSAGKNRVPCPVCGVSVPGRNINLHLDRCLTAGDKKEGLRSNKKRKPLPKLVYSLMSEKDIRKKLKEVGLSTQGDKQALIKRHHEFRLIYNSECDALNPKSAEEIVKEMERREKAKGKLNIMGNTKGTMKIGKGFSQDQVENAQKQYMKEHKSQFDKLIEEVRKRRKQKSASKDIRSVEREESQSINEEKTTQPPADNTPQQHETASVPPEDADGSTDTGESASKTDTGSVENKTELVLGHIIMCKENGQGTIGGQNEGCGIASGRQGDKLLDESKDEGQGGLEDNYEETRQLEERKEDDKTGVVDGNNKDFGNFDIDSISVSSCSSFATSEKEFVFQNGQINSTDETLEASSDSQPRSQGQGRRGRPKGRKRGRGRPARTSRKRCKEANVDNSVSGSLDRDMSSSNTDQSQQGLLYSRENTPVPSTPQSSGEAFMKTPSKCNGRSSDPSPGEPQTPELIPESPVFVRSGNNTNHVTANSLVGRPRRQKRKEKSLSSASSNPDENSNRRPAKRRR